MKKVRFNNNDLNFEIEKIKSFDLPIVVSKEIDTNLNYPFALDVEDSSYWYENEKERDEDFATLKSVVPEFFYIDAAPVY